MDPHDLRRELDRFDPEAPLAEAWTPPASWYLRPEVLEAERAVFRGTWQAVGALARVAEPGAWLAGEILGEPFLVVRGADGELRAFHNACRHHAALIVEGAGRCAELVCPYHGWTYGLDGRLVKAPRLGAVRGFDRADFGLAPIAVAAWGPLVLVHLGPDPRPLEADLGPLAAMLAERGTERLVHVGTREYVVESNWKVYVDNYLDGGYHVAHAHRGLAAQLGLADYRTELYERFNVQLCPGEAAAPDAAEGAGRDAERAFGRRRIGGGALYAWVYPNLTLNRYGPVLDANLVFPLGHGRCRVVFEDWFEPEADAAFRAESLATSDRVQAEDAELCRRVQAGLASPGYGRGRYAVPVEAGELQFHRMLHADLCAGAAATAPSAR